MIIKHSFWPIQFRMKALLAKRHI